MSTILRDSIETARLRSTASHKFVEPSLSMSTL